MRSDDDDDADDVNDDVNDDESDEPPDREVVDSRFSLSSRCPTEANAANSTTRPADATSGAVLLLSTSSVLSTLSGPERMRRWRWRRWRRRRRPLPDLGAAEWADAGTAT